MDAGSELCPEFSDVGFGNQRCVRARDDLDLNLGGELSPSQPGIPVSYPGLIFRAKQSHRAGVGLRTIGTAGTGVGLAQTDQLFPLPVPIYSHFNQSQGEPIVQVKQLLPAPELSEALQLEVDPTRHPKCRSSH